MQPILIDGGQFVPQRLVEEIEDTRLASHHLLLESKAAKLLT
jgi:hypothetical protein